MLLDRFEKLFPLQTGCLKHAKKNAKMAHAYLVNGDNMDMRQDFALLIAQIAICPDSDENGSPCGSCRVCEKLENGTYPELYTLMPSSKSRIIPVGDTVNPEEDTVRWFENLFYLTSATEEGMKIGIIHDADRMQPQAQNAFLKTLEEPPPNTLFVLTTGNSSRLLPTTISRCQTLPLITNKCVYDFTGCDELFSVLKELQFDCAGDLGAAEGCVEKILDISKSLDFEAKEIVAEKWGAQLESAKEDLEAAGRKRIEKRIEAAERAEYLKLRTYFLSAIHTWFALVYQLSNGSAEANTANPEILAKAILPENLNEKSAGKALGHAEKLLSNLNFNISEELAIRNFCLNVAMN